MSVVVSSRRPKVAVILPAYNEEHTIADVIHDFHTTQPDALIVVADNNSNDATAGRAEETFASLNIKGLLLSEPRQGKANAIRRAFREVDADYYVMVDADSTYPASSLKDLLAPALNGRADMVVGDRHAEGHYAKQNKRRFHSFGNRLIRLLINRIFAAKLNDILSGYRVFSRQFVKNYPILVHGFELETDLTLHALDKRLTIVEVPITYIDRPSGSESKLSTMRDGIRVLRTILHIVRHSRPLTFFASLSAATSALGFLAGLPAILDYIQFNYVYHVPLAILASSLELVALLLLMTGLILDSIARFHRLDFELRLLSRTEDDERS